MLELVGVDHGAHRLHQAVGDVEGEHADHPALGVVDHRTRLAVDHGRHGVGALFLRPAEQPEQEPGDPVRAVRGLAPGQALAAAVADHDHVGRQEFEQPVDVTAAHDVEEPAGHLIALLTGGLVPRLALVDVVPGAGEDLTAVRLGLAGDLGDLRVSVTEHLVQQEHGTFGRGQAFQQDEEGHGQGIGHLGALRGVRGGRGAQLARDEWFGKPGTHVGFPPDPRGPQVADGQPGSDRGQVGLGRSDALALAQRTGQPQEGLLDDVLGVADAASHPVGDREHQRPELQVVRGGLRGHGAFPALKASAQTGNPSRQLG
jgi:hypothetical protein